MRRRTFLGMAAGAIISFPATVLAQHTTKIPRIGVLWHAGNEQEEAIPLGGLRKGFSELGYVEGKNIELLNRFADEHVDRFEGLAAELIDAKVDVIVASMAPAAIHAKRLTSTIPIVVAYGSNYIELGLAQSLAHPGGNLTGLTAVHVDLAAKELEILNDAMPNMSTAALLVNPNPPATSYREQYISEVRTAADALHVALQLVQASSPEELEKALSTAADIHSNAVLIVPSGLFYQQMKRIAELAIAQRLPMIGFTAEFADAGALISHGADTPDFFRRAAGYVDKILKGANPADLPIEQPTKFELILNQRTAKAINFTFPPTLLFRADRVIE